MLCIAVLDTNIMVKALISETSLAAHVFDAFLAGQFTLATSESILDEIRRTLAKPTLQALIADIEQVQIEEKLSTLRCMSYRVNVMQSGGARMASVCVERLDH